MAPPPSSSLSVQDRLLQLAQTLQFSWFIGHLTLLLCVVFYCFYYMTFNFYSPFATITYRAAFFSAAATYGIVVYKAFRARARASGRTTISPLALASDENVQYLAMAFVWLWSRQYPLAMLPFGVYSIFHIATYTRGILVPTFQASSPSGSTSPTNSSPKPNTISDTIGRFVKKYYDASMGLVALLEIAILGRIILAAITFTKGSWILLIVYSTFLRARYAQSSFVQHQFRNLEARIDSLVGAQSTPPAVRQAWDTVKISLRTFHDATDVNKFIARGSSTQRKTS